MSYLKMALQALEDLKPQTENIPRPAPGPIDFEPLTAIIPDRILTCYECGHFRPAASPNPTQAWGRCEKRKRGRYACATACEAVLEVSHDL